MLWQALQDLGAPRNSLPLLVASILASRDIKNTINKFIFPEGKIPTAKTSYKIKNKYSQDYMKKVRKALMNLAEDRAKYGEHVSLRNLAEMTVRHEEAIENINSLKRRGVNLVVSTVHANCSDRCAKWQGKYYTLDNTYQTYDGKRFQPLSNATDIYYTTKAGKVYKNGHITGFNCRHRLLPYKPGMRIPRYSAKLISRERAIDIQMRRYEEEIRKAKDIAAVFKDVDDKIYKAARAKAIKLNKIYKDYAISNNRRFYPTRTQI